MQKMIAVLLILGASLIVTANAEEGPRTSSPLDLRLVPMRLQVRDTPLPTALAELGAKLRGGYVSFGVELRLIDGHEPSISVDIAPGVTLGEALEKILHCLDGYKYKVISEHLVNIYPASSLTDPQNLLNLRVSHFDVVSEYPGNVQSRPADFIPELASALNPPALRRHSRGEAASVLSDASGPQITLHLRNVTVRQILNAVSHATEDSPPNYGPHGWVWTFAPDPALPGGGKYSWHTLVSVPHDWKEQAAQSR